MSTRAKAAAALASLGVIVVGWQAATANGQTVSAPSTSDTPSSSTPSTTNAADVSSTSPTASSSSSSASSSGSSAATGATGTFTGATSTDRYGSVTVTVTLNNGKITKVSEKVVDDGEGRSQSINSRAIPVLRQEVLSANSANVSSVSGATYTSQAYLTSLQSALDKA